MIGVFQFDYCFHVPWLPQAFAGFSCVVGFDVSFIVGIHATGISAPLSLSMLFGLSLV